MTASRWAPDAAIFSSSPVWTIPNRSRATIASPLDSTRSLASPGKTIPFTSPKAASSPGSPTPAVTARPTASRWSPTPGVTAPITNTPSAPNSTPKEISTSPSDFPSPTTHGNSSAAGLLKSPLRERPFLSPAASAAPAESASMNKARCATLKAKARGIPPAV